LLFFSINYSLQGFAVKKLLDIVDDFWAEIADEVPLM
jgi:hypothetical protein